MLNGPNDMQTFFNELTQVAFQKRKCKMPFIADNLPVNEHECHYILDLINNKMLHKTGFKSLLGYDDDKVDHIFLFNNIHPEDSEIVHRITRSAILHFIENPVKNPDHHSRLCLTYRHKTITGDYIRVLNQVSLVEVNDRGFPVLIMIKLRNISFMGNTGIVSWAFEAPGLDLAEFTEAIYRPYKNFFTERETSVLQEMAKGCGNKEISANLMISEHTVATHRKNIYKKSGCHNLLELVNYCREKGILQPMSA